MRRTAWFALGVGLSIGSHADEAKKGLSDPQIATIALTAHQIDIDRGRLALKHTRNDEVKQFADQMVQDHEAGKREALDLARKLGVKPEESAATKSLKADAGKVASRLARKKGAAYDRDYIGTEVAYHEAVIDAVKNTLVPRAQNKQLRTLLENVVPTLEGHLRHAKNVQAQLPSSK